MTAVPRNNAVHLDAGIADAGAIEAAAAEFAAGAGALLAGYFGRALDIEYKDRAQQDPVTAADKAAQAYLERQIARRFPGHGILGEEDDATRRNAADSAPAPDFLWVLDPLDGTTNFMNGLPSMLRPLACCTGAAPWPAPCTSPGRRRTPAAG